MKDGICSRTCSKPLTKPNTAPISNVAGMAIQAIDPSVPPNAINMVAKRTAHTETAPSIDRSMDPMMMMKVTPSATMSGGVAASAMRAAFRKEKKLGLITEKAMINAKSTRNGAHRTMSERVRKPLTWRPADPVVIRLAPAEAWASAGGYWVHLYWIWPLVGPQKSFQS